LEETKRKIERRGAAFVLRSYPDHDLPRFCAEAQLCVVVGDENPMREPERWRQSAARNLSVPFWTVDADVVVPSKLFPKEEYAARTIRPKLQKLLPVFLQQPDNLKARYHWAERNKPGGRKINPSRLLDELPLDRNAEPAPQFKGGPAEGMRLLRRFINKRLPDYETARNQPQIAGTSELSAYLHFGHLGPLTIALAVREADAPETAKAAFLEELIVRRELAINYVARNPQYDRLAGSPEWGRKTLAEHAADPRPYHWAKKILEWTEAPEEAFEIAVRLNDRYELDGRDPNGYAGVAWAVGGKHDRPWGPQRPVFGLIRYMSSEGCARKFDVRAYIEKVNKLARINNAP
jgi:deoxyribodipyrimidine photo-lyase